mmetsp:Transcript_17622/g.29756  ORF Transcript_17622/g.29756 Transcript_17622/m.29756 type:complete len:270 (-) Transcript_17622:80-889(-)
MKRDIQIKLKAVSADHCAIAYTKEKGWTITEKGKDRLSSNGTFIFMKSMQQANDHIPSDLIPLHDDMIISFVNYELKVSLLQKTSDVVKQQHDAMEYFFNNKGSMPNPALSQPRPSQQAQPEPTYTAEVQAQNQPSAQDAKSEVVPEQSVKAESQRFQEQIETPAEHQSEVVPSQNPEPVVEATEEELAHAATKIGAAFRGKKARTEVAELKAKKDKEVEDSKQQEQPEAQAQPEASQNAEDIQPPASENQVEEAKQEGEPAASEQKEE